MGARGFWGLVGALLLLAVVVVGVAAGDDEGRAVPDPVRAAEAASSTVALPSSTAASSTVPVPSTAASTTVPVSLSSSTTVPVPSSAATVPPTAPATTVAPAPPAFVPTDPRLVVFGDSVVLGTQPVLPGALAGWDVRLEAAVNRWSKQMVGVVEQARPAIGQAVVLQVGNNYFEGRSTYAANLERILASLADVPRVVLLTVAEVRPDRAEVNAEVRAAAARHANVVVADWHALWAGTPGLTARDGLHLTGAGARAMLDLIAGALGPPPAG